jgi:hypothetical protein
MIGQLIAEHDELPALPAERRLLFFHRGISGALESAVDENIQGLRTAFDCFWPDWTVCLCYQRWLKDWFFSEQ